MSLLGTLHGDLVFKRRTRVLSARLVDLLPHGATVLDVGCGDGMIAKMIGERRPDLTVSGTDIVVRSNVHIPITKFDGQKLLYEDQSTEVVMFIDFLHHTENHEVLLQEARRVARKAIVLKDHTCDGLLARPTLRFMDWVGNAPHGVPLPYNYWSERRWREAIARLNLEPSAIHQ